MTAGTRGALCAAAVVVALLGNVPGRASGQDVAGVVIAPPVLVPGIVAGVLPGPRQNLILRNETSGDIPEWGILRVIDLNWGAYTQPYWIEPIPAGRGRMIFDIFDFKHDYLVTFTYRAGSTGESRTEWAHLVGGSGVPTLHLRGKRP